MPRLRTLLLARNRISNISLGLERSIPNLRTLVLESNRVTELADLDALASLRRLQHLVLMGNPVCKKEVWATRPRYMTATCMLIHSWSITATG